MNVDRAVMIGCAALLVVSVFANQREGAQVTDTARYGTAEAVRTPASPPTPDDTWNAEEATSALALLMVEGCIEWTDLDERRWMTCGDTVPAVQVVSYERRFVP